jgi:UDP-N-acetyl-D-mannosaminuronate dehydrogenase
MIHSARQVNDSMPRYVTNLILRTVSGTKSPRVALMGVSYKPNSSDTINSPAIQILDHLSKENLEVVLCDPLVTSPGLDLVSIEEAMESDCIVFLLPHDVFKELQPTSPRRGRGSLIDITHGIDLDLWAGKGWKVYGFASASRA